MGSSGAGPDGGYPRDGMASPSWQRPPASPVSTPQVRPLLSIKMFVVIVLCVFVHTFPKNLVSFISIITGGGWFSWGGCI